MKLKVPYYKQAENTTCGVACVRMVLGFYGKEVTESELAEVCETGWLGNTCGELVRGLEEYDFEAEEVENTTADYISDLLNQKNPLIVLLDPAVLYGGLEGFGHFVVITGFEDGIFYYHDPDLDQDLKAHLPIFFQACKQFSCKGVRIWKSTKK